MCPHQDCKACPVGGCGDGAGIVITCAQARLHCNSCALLSRVLESLLVSLVTTVVVFVASMVLGECRQMSSTSQTGNGSFQLQVTLTNLVSILQAEKCVRFEPCCSCLQLSVLCLSPARMSSCLPPFLCCLKLSCPSWEALLISLLFTSLQARRNTLAGGPATHHLTSVISFRG